MYGPMITDYAETKLIRMLGVAQIVVMLVVIVKCFRVMGLMDMINQIVFMIVAQTNGMRRIFRVWQMI